MTLNIKYTLRNAGGGTFNAFRDAFSLAEHHLRVKFSSHERDKVVGVGRSVSRGTAVHPWICSCLEVLVIDDNLCKHLVSEALPSYGIYLR
jgi:hypothetical protein